VGLAVGVVSAPGRDALRRDARQTWMAHRFVPSNVAVRFVMQAGGAERARILAEGFEDVLLVDYDGDASRTAWRKQWVWLEFAAHAFPNASHIVHAEDDAYLNLAAITRALASPVFGKSVGALHVTGQLEAFSWVPSLGCPVGWSNTLRGAASGYRAACAARDVRPCFGPFVFAGGFFAALSTPLVRALLASGAAIEASDSTAPACPREAALRWQSEMPLQAAHISLRKFGGTLSDDVWLGYAIRKHLALAPVRYVQLVEPLVSSSWFTLGRVHRSTLAMHDRVKSVMTPRAASAWNVSTPIDADWSRVRRAHVFSHRFGCVPRLEVEPDARSNPLRVTTPREIGEEGNGTMLSMPVAWRLLRVRQAAAVSAAGVREPLWSGPCAPLRQATLGGANTVEVKTKYSIEAVLSANPVDGED
jgi:hypothetical protein